MCSSHFPFLSFSFPIQQMRRSAGTGLLNTAVKVVHSFLNSPSRRLWSRVRGCSTAPSLTPPQSLEILLVNSQKYWDSQKYYKIWREDNQAGILIFFLFWQGNLEETSEIKVNNVSDSSWKKWLLQDPTKMFQSPGGGGREGWFHPRLGRANPDTICSSKSQETEGRLHILTKTAYVLKQRLLPPMPSGRRKVEKIHNTQFSDVGRENTLVPDNGGGDTISEQVECLYIAAQVCARGKEMTQSLMIYYIHVSISQKKKSWGGRENHELQKTKPNLGKNITQGTEGIFSQFLHIIAQLDRSIN